MTQQPTPENTPEEPIATTPQEMLEFLAARFEYDGVSKSVAALYAQEIRKILKEHFGAEA